MRISPNCSFEDICSPTEELLVHQSLKNVHLNNYNTVITAKTKEDEEIHYQVTTTQNNHPDEFINPLSEGEETRSARDEY